jgi:hypothetical protein
MATIVLWIVAAAFAADTAFVLIEMGYRGFVGWALYNSATRLMFADLVIALSLVMIWMLQDSRRTGRRVLPYILVTLAFGSLGPLLYLGLGRRHPARSKTTREAEARV